MSPLVLFRHLLWILCLFTPKSVSALPLHLIAVFPQEGDTRGGNALARALRKAVSDSDSGLFERDVTLLATPFFSPRASQPLLVNLCNALKRQQPPPAALVSFVGPPLSFYVSLLGSHMKVPVLGMTRSYEDRPAKSVHPYYLSLDPNAEDLAHATGLLLSYNSWAQAIVIRDSSTFYMSFTATLYHHYIRGNKFQIILNDRLSDGQLFEMVAEVLHSEVRVIVVACGQLLAERIFRQARKAGLLNGRWIWILIESAFSINGLQGNGELHFPPGVLGLKLRKHGLDRAAVRSAVLFFSNAMTHYSNLSSWTLDKDLLNYTSPVSCWFGPDERREAFANFVYRSVFKQRRLNGSSLLAPVFDIYNLVPHPGRPLHHVTDFDEPVPRRWKRIGNVTGSRVSLNAVFWLNKKHVGPPQKGQERFRIVTAFAPPFVMRATRVENESCLLGLPCLQVKTNSKSDLSRLFSDYHGSRLLEGLEYNVSCCAGISIDLLKTLSADLNFAFDLYLVADGYFGTKRGSRWNGMTLDVQSGAAHMVFTAFSVTSERSRVIDYSVPFYHSGVSCLTYTQERDVPLSAFLIPFSAQLWIAIFLCLNVTAITAAIYEWLSPFGLNPWGRMRNRNFSLASALWVMWSLLFSHLVAFKAPKSWPNKVLINLWGCFSVIFVSSYTANIAAHFAGLFFHLRVYDFHDASLLSQRTGTAKGSAAESYIYAQNPQLWQHIQKYGFADLEEGLEKLRRGELGVLIGDTVVLDYFRGNDPGCSLHLLGQSIFDDAYAVGMQKGFRLKKSISTLILRYNEYGLMEQLQKKWFGRVPCFNHSVHRLNKPQPLSLRSVAGVFLMLLLGGAFGILILFMEHAVFKHALPQLRKKPQECFWKSPNVMFFSQKLYRFINTVELVSPHHSAKEIVTNIKEGQIFSLFQKSVKRKAKEEARRRRSKSQFFEMIQEIRKMVRLQKENPETVITAEPQLLPQRVRSPVLVGSPVGPLDTERLIFVPPSSSSPPKTGSSWTDLCKRAPLCFGNTKYSHLQQYEEPSGFHLNVNQLDTSPPLYRRSHCLVRSVSPLENLSSSSGEDQQQPAFNTTVLSISVEDLRLVDSAGTDFRKLKRHRSLDEILWKKNYPHSPRRKKVSTASEPKMAVRKMLEVDELLLYSMSKEEIIRSWQASERKLLNRLRDAIKEKRSLEKKLAFIQKTLVKPP
ncbi:glutamate receptor ionotropic, NMDA 3A-like [Argiope bruennichi]|uniref:glutamate receptor ionotropic, NMDA 3A-like n=1 Tax=Argiope bruennichi TaxID=94029 RepID=UPI002494249A|nr:glutamate receptor ionotropic, NMDA 3A-like [Argiope bruennichi]